MRAKILTVSLAVLPALLRADASLKVVSHGLPADAVVTDAAVTGATDHGAVCLVVESETFDDVPEGMAFPEMEPVVFSQVAG